MHFVETPIFTREVTHLIPEDEYRSLQLALLFRPEQGTLIPGTGGLRKLRWRSSGKGKRVVFGLSTIGIKNKQEDLTPEQVRVLSRLVQEELK